MEQPPHADTGMRIRAAVAWAVIAACLAAVVWRTIAEQREDQPATHRTPAIGNELRVLLGTHRLMVEAAGAQPGRVSLAQVDGLVRTPADRLAIAVAAAEIEGGPAAVRRLQAVDASELAPTVAALERIYAEEADPAEVDPAIALAMRRDLGWLAEIALTHDLPADAPARLAAWAPAVRAATVLGVMLLLLLLAAMVGLVLWVLAAVRWRSAGVAMPPAPPTHPTGLLEAFAVYLLAFLAFQVALGALVGTGLLPRDAVIWAMWAFLPIVLLLPLVPMKRGARLAEVRLAVGAHRGAGIVREMGAGVLGWFATLPALLLAVLLSNWLRQTFDLPTDHPIGHEFAAAEGAQLIWLLALACIFAPLVEEFTFRGFLLAHLRRRLHWLAAAVVSGVVFAALHPQGLAAIPVLATLGAAFAILRMRRGSLIAPITAHACNNGAVALLLVAGLR